MTLDALLDALADRVAARVAEKLGASASATGGYLTTREVAERLGVTVETVSARCADGRIPAVRLPGGRVWLVKPEALEATLAKSTGCSPANPEPVPAAPIDLRAARIAAAVAGKRGPRT